MTVRFAVVLKPDSWAGAVHGVVLRHPAQQALGYQFGTHIALAAPDRRKFVPGDERSVDDIRTIALDE
ncbi:hypothetical protein WL38_20315 [Burkholderia ubonensis]|nr:hypothetical protein WL38_20315 [Burkholderia ubonensis]